MVAWRRMCSSARPPTFGALGARRRAARPRRSVSPSLTARTSISTSQPSPRSLMPSATSAGNFIARTGPTPRPAVAVHVSIRPSTSLSRRCGGPRRPRARARRRASAIGATSVGDDLGCRRAIAGDEHDDVGYARQRREVRLRAQTGRAIAAARLAQDQRAGVAGELGGAIASTRESTTTTERSCAVRELAQYGRQARRMIARRHNDVDQRGGIAPRITVVHRRRWRSPTRTRVSTSTPATRWSIGSSRSRRRRMRPEVLGGIGGFAALCRIPTGYQEPILVSGTDGVGTKLKTAFAANKPRHDRHRPRRDVRQRRARHRRRAAVLPRLLRDRRARRRHRATRHRGHRRGLPAGRLRARRRRDRRAARASITARTTTSPGSASASSRGRRSGRARDLAAGDVVIGLPSAGLHSQRSLARAQGRARDAEAAARRAADGARRRRRSPTSCCGRRSSTPMRSRALEAACRGRPPRTSPAAGSSRIRRGSSRDDALAVELDPTTWSVPAHPPADRSRPASSPRRCAARSTWASA